MIGCCAYSVGRRVFQQEMRKYDRQDLFHDLTHAVWDGDVQETVKILVKDPTLVSYRQFKFYLPEKTNSILTYAEVLGRQTIIEVLLGFGATSGASA